MKSETGDGQFTLSFEHHRIQLYWPYIKWSNFVAAPSSWRSSKKELIISADSVFRWVWQKDYWGVGFQLLGFGIAMDHYLTKLNNE